MKFERFVLFFWRVWFLWVRNEFIKEIYLQKLFVVKCRAIELSPWEMKIFVYLADGAEQPFPAGIKAAERWPSARFLESFAPLYMVNVDDQQLQWAQNKKNTEIKYCWYLFLRGLHKFPKLYFFWQFYPTLASEARDFPDVEPRLEDT